MTDKPKHWLGKLHADVCLRYTALFFLVAVDILSITAISIGFTFQGQCLINQHIPIYLIVGGLLFTIYFTVLLLVLCMIIRSTSIYVAQISKRRLGALSVLITIMCLFMTGWTIAGCVWVFGTKSKVQSYDSTQSTYCHSVLYDYAFFYCIFLLIICFIHYFSYYWILRT